MGWLDPLEVERARPRRELTPAQRRAFFGHMRGVWILRFLDFTEPEGEAELIAEIHKHGFLEAQTYQDWTLRDGCEEWSAVADPNTREIDRKQGRSQTHHDFDPHWLQKEKAAKRFWQDAAGTAPPPLPMVRVNIRCINCGEPAACIWRAQPYCLECFLEEKAESE